MSWLFSYFWNNNITDNSKPIETNIDPKPIETNIDPKPIETNIDPKPIEIKSSSLSIIISPPSPLPSIPEEVHDIPPPIPENYIVLYPISPPPTPSPTPPPIPPSLPPIPPPLPETIQIDSTPPPIPPPLPDTIHIDSTPPSIPPPLNEVPFLPQLEEKPIMIFPCAAITFPPKKCSQCQVSRKRNSYYFIQWKREEGICKKCIKKAHKAPTNNC